MRLQSQEPRVNEYYGLMGIKCLACLALKICNSTLSVTPQLNRLGLIIIRSQIQAIYVVLIRDFLQNFVVLLCGSVIFSARHFIPMRP